MFSSFSYLYGYVRNELCAVKSYNVKPKAQSAKNGLTAFCSFRHLQKRLPFDPLTEALADVIVSNGGIFPKRDQSGRPSPSKGGPLMKVIKKEPPFAAHFFTVWLGTDKLIGWNNHMRF